MTYQYNYIIDANDELNYCVLNTEKNSRAIARTFHRKTKPIKQAAFSNEGTNRAITDFGDE